MHQTRFEFNQRDNNLMKANLWQLSGNIYQLVSRQIQGLRRLLTGEISTLPRSRYIAAQVENGKFGSPRPCQLGKTSRDQVRVLNLFSPLGSLSGTDCSNFQHVRLISAAQLMTVDPYLTELTGHHCLR